MNGQVQANCENNVFHVTSFDCWSHDSLAITRNFAEKHLELGTFDHRQKWHFWFTTRDGSWKKIARVYCGCGTDKFKCKRKNKKLEARCFAVMLDTNSLCEKSNWIRGTVSGCCFPKRGCATTVKWSSKMESSRLDEARELNEAKNDV